MTANREVTLYTRNGCGLCDEAAIELRALSVELGFSFVERDIDRETALRDRYSDVVPVVLADGREVVHAPFVAVVLRELLVEAFA